MKEMCDSYLPQDWEDQVCNDILTSTLAGSKMLFWNWSQHMLKLNCLLQGTTSVFDDASLCNHLEAHLDANLKTIVKHNDTRKDKVLKTWVAVVQVLDEA
jgi:hypothetical protein